MGGDVKAFVKKRIEHLQTEMEKTGLSAVILQKPENVFYFSNFNPVINSHPVYVIVLKDQAPVLLVHSIRYNHAVEEGAIDRVELFGKWGSNIPLAMNAVDAIYAVTGELKGSIGLEFNYLSIETFNQIREKYPAAEFASVSGMVDMMKIIKDEYEIGCIRTSAALVDEGVSVTIEALKGGLSEAEASTEGQYAMRRLWHEKYKDCEVCGFGTSEGGMIDSLHVWSLSNGHIAYGCDCPKHYHPRSGDLTLPMAWAKTSGYHAENERTVIVGKLDPFRQNAYDAMLRAREAVFKILRPGIRFEELYDAAAAVYTEAGFGSILPGRVGHGVGSSAHEFPSLARGNKIPLQPGMAVTVEPGLMDKAWGGVRHSDTVLITDDGYERLTKLENGEIRINIGE